MTSNSTIPDGRSEEHTSELQSLTNRVIRNKLENKGFGNMHLKQMRSIGLNPSNHPSGIVEIEVI